MRTISESTTYLGIIIEYTADVYSPEKDVRYVFPTVENLQIQSFAGADWQEVCHLFMQSGKTNSMGTAAYCLLYDYCYEHAFEIAMSEEGL